MTRQKRVLALLYLTSLMSYPYTAQIRPTALAKQRRVCYVNCPDFYETRWSFST